MAKVKFKMAGPKASAPPSIPMMPMKPGGAMAPPIKYQPESPSIPLNRPKKAPAVKFRVSRASGY